MQQRFHDYNRPLVSFDENQRVLGLLWPGRYCGFDNVTLGSSTITLLHGLSGIQETNIDQNLTSPKGVFITRQGVVIKEDNSVGPLAISSNASNAFKRVDTIVVEHEIVNVAGGSEAIYSIIQGPDGSELPAPLTAPEKQIVLGYFTMQASSATTGGGIYTPAPVYHNGGLIAAILNQNNRYSNLNEFSTFTATRVALSDGTEDWIGITSLTGNTIKNVTQSGVANEIYFLPKTQSGTFLFIQNNAGTGLTIAESAVDLGSQLPPELWGDYAAISTITESNVVIAPGGWAILHCADGESANPIYRVLLTSTDATNLATFEAGLVAVNSAVSGRVNRTIEGWRTVGDSGQPAFGANFSASAGRNPQFKKDDNNTVYLRGAVQWGIGGSNTTVFQLPSGYRPTGQPVTFANMVLEEPLSITIQTNGNVEIFCPALGGVSSAGFNISCQFRID